LEYLYVKYTDGEQALEAGCNKVASDIWHNKEGTVNYQINGVFEGPDVTKDYCLTNGKVEGFEIRIVINIKKKSIPGIFSCIAFEEDVGEVVSEQLKFEVIKGKFA